MPASRRAVKSFAFSRLALLLALGGLSGVVGCSSTPKSTPELSRLEGKRIALVDVHGESTARRVVAVALVNQLVKSGDFDLLSKQEVDAARVAIGVDTTSPTAVARKARADYALVANVLKFDTQEHSGYSKEEINDSQLEAERGDGRTERIYKVRSLVGEVAIELVFTDVRTGEVRRATAERAETVTTEDKTGRGDLPLRLRFLERLSNEAFAEFFEKNR